MPKIIVTNPPSSGSGAALPQPLGVQDSPTFDKIYVTNNGNGTNVKIGDDAWIGDVDLSNHVAITGVENSTEGGIVFGSDGASSITGNGTDLNLHAAANINLYADAAPGWINLSAYEGAYVNGISADNKIVTMKDLDHIDRLVHAVKAGTALTKGQAVYVSSADGTNMIVSKASNNAESTSSKTMGLITATLANNDIGEVITEGLLDGLDTSTANAGDPVWLGTDGNLLYGLANKPIAPAHLVFIGIVTRKQQNNGEIFVRPQNGFELNELHDVDLDYSVNPADNDLLAFDTASSMWKNQTASEAGLIASNSNAILKSTNEAFSTINAATGVVAHNYSNGAVFNHTNIAANFTANITNLVLASGYGTSITLILNQGAAAYIPNALQIGGVAQTINWQGGSAPSGNINKKDIVSFSIINNSGTYTVLGQLVSFG